MANNENTRFAENALGVIVEAEKGMDKSQSFTCLGCGEKVGAYAINTKIQAAHFRHTDNLSGSGTGCRSYESYLHNLSKRKFAENFQYISVFELKRDMHRLQCKSAKHDNCFSLHNDVINLKERYPHVKIEKRDGNFVPDCLIYNDDGDKIYIEIKYKSPISVKKRNSGIPIIEISVSSEKEIGDIVANGEINASKKEISLINFENIAPNEAYDCGGECPVEMVAKAKEAALEKKVATLKEVEEKRLSSMKDVTPVKPCQRPEIIGVKTVQLFRPKICFACEGQPLHYMNVGRIFIDNKYNVAAIDDDLFKDEITQSEKISIAKRVETGETNAYYCPDCGTWIANNRILGRNSYVYTDEEVIEC